MISFMPTLIDSIHTDSFNTAAIRVDTTRSIRPLASVLDFTPTWLDLTVIFLFVSLVIAGTLWVIRRNKGRTAGNEGTPFALTDPYQWASGQLHQIWNDPATNRPPYTAFYTQMDAVIRQFLSLTQQIDANRLTTTTTLKRWKEKSNALAGSTAVFGLLKEILEEADQIKFSGTQPVPHQAELFWKKCIQLTLKPSKS